jgi:hypothetical protein
MSIAITQKTTNLHDLVVIPAHRVGEHERVGEILELAGEPGHERYRVRWDDGRESVFYPGRHATIRHRTHTPGDERR